MPNLIRAFIAVKIPSTPALREVISQLALMGRPVKSVAADKLHVTLKFLGDTNSELIPEVGRILHAVCESKSAFDLRIVGCGAFPHAARPSVIWAGLENTETLIELSVELETQLQPLGFSAEKREFQPHLTLARVKSKPPGELATLLAERASTEFGVASIKSVELRQSELRPEGPKYTLLASVQLSRS